MALKGDLGTFYISNILQLLTEENKTGVLKLFAGKKQVEIILKDGSIVYALGAKLEFKLGNILKDNHIITDAQLKAALAEGKNKNLAIGNILVQQGLVSRETLKKYVQEQVKEVIYDVFLWGTGEFEYNDVAVNLERVIVSPLNTTRILLEASRRIDEMAIFKRHIPADNSVFQTPRKIGTVDSGKHSSEETRIIDLINGKRSVKDLMEASHLNRFSTYKILYALISSGMIEIAMPNPTNETLYSSIIKSYYDILHVIFKNIEQYLGEEASRLFTENKPVIEPAQKNVIKNFDHRLSVSDNIGSILSDMKNFNNMEEGFTVLANSFNMYILNILLKVPKMIGEEQAATLLRDVDLALLYIGRLQTLPDDKYKIVSDVEFIIQKVRQNLNITE